LSGPLAAKIVTYRVHIGIFRSVRPKGQVPAGGLGGTCGLKTFVPNNIQSPGVDNGK
jgi:hypothetical protein